MRGIFNMAYESLQEYHESLEGNRSTLELAYRWSLENKYHYDINQVLILAQALHTLHQDNYDKA